jgi:hypothetical protein
MANLLSVTTQSGLLYLLGGHPFGSLAPYQLHLAKMSCLYLSLYYFNLPTPPIYLADVCLPE